MIEKNNGTYSVYIYSDYDSRTGQQMPTGVVPWRVGVEGMEYVHPAVLATPTLVIKGQRVHGVEVPSTYSGTADEVLRHLGIYIDHDGRARTQPEARIFPTMRVGNMYVLPQAPRLGDYIGQDRLSRFFCKIEKNVYNVEYD